ncbi:rhodanese-like domain-containing protein [Seongchinamella unica]|nr:rhodanese-like domain-containing protein [Seongchinamella unica]
MAIYRSIALIWITLLSAGAVSDITSKQEIVQEAKSKASHISSEQLANYLSGTESIVLLDVRTEAEYQAGHIKGAQWFPRGKIEFYIQGLVEDPAAKIVLYCRSGGRSALSALTMKEMGYTNVVDLDGGFREWVAQGNTFYNLHGEHKVVSYQKKE